PYTAGVSFYGVRASANASWRCRLFGRLPKFSRSSFSRSESRQNLRVPIQMGGGMVPSCSHRRILRSLVEYLAHSLRVGKSTSSAGLLGIAGSRERRDRPSAASAEPVAIWFKRGQLSKQRTASLELTIQAASLAEARRRNVIRNFRHGTAEVKHRYGNLP